MNFIQCFVALGFLCAYTKACPNGCSCQPHFEHGETVSCKGPGIISFPRDIPRATETIKLENTNVSDIPKDAFSNLMNLREIYINFNKKLTTLPSGIFNNTDLKELQIVNLNSNELRSLPDNLFNNLPNLGNVYLKDNGLSELPPNTFRNLPELALINVEKNKLKSLPESLLDDSMTKFTEGSFSYNQLSSLPNDIFKPVKETLEYLYIDTNQFKFLPMNAFRIIGKQFLEINVYYNPTYCNCSIAEFLNWVKKNNVRVLGMACQINVTNCELPTTMTPTTAPITTQLKTTRTEPSSIPSTIPTTTTEPSTTPTKIPITTPEASTTQTSSTMSVTSKPKVATSEKQPSTTEAPSTQQTKLRTSTEEKATKSSTQKSSTQKTFKSPTTESIVKSTKDISDSGNIETQDTGDENEQRKKVIIAVSVAAVAIVVLCSLILCLFHTGILSTRRFRKDKVVIYDAEGNVLVTDKEGAT